jgi:hypothetical protein
MNTRREFVKLAAATGVLTAASGRGATAAATTSRSNLDSSSGSNDRAYWCQVAGRLAAPMLSALAQRRLKVLMPFESPPTSKDRRRYMYLEGLGRLLAGVAPWFELGNDGSPEGEERSRFAALARAGIDAGTGPASPDFFNFSKGRQPLVDAAFLAQAMLRASNELWKKLEPRVQKNVVSALQPMLVEALDVVADEVAEWETFRGRAIERLTRYAAIQERLIAPDGSYPAIGRSIAYRAGAFEGLAVAALRKILPKEVTPAQARVALTRVIRRTMEAPGTFDAKGWLKIGLAGQQPGLGETYISTGSLYLCSVALLPLGLPAADPFWASPPVKTTWERIWSGENLPADKALKSPQ